jgi:hypothetical protein
MFQICEYVRKTHSQDGGIVLDVKHGQMFRLNFVGSRMLELLKQGFSEPQIAVQISREFGADLEIVQTHLREFLAHLEKHNLLERGDLEPHAEL